MAVSYNGWSAGSRYVRTYTIPGTSQRISLRSGDASVVLLYFASQFNRRVERLVVGWNWGYAYRATTGARTLSNHASGTAIDLNAPRHAYGRRNTFSAAKVRVIRQIMAECGGVLRWGGDYARTRDDMHFEINAGSASVKRAADAIRRRGTPAASRPASKPSALTVNGRLDRATITRWQKVMGTPADGVISSTSLLTKQVQRHLNARLSGPDLRVDGRGLPPTNRNGFRSSTIKALQRYLGTSQDGELSSPKSSAVVALQQRLNNGRF